MTNPSGISAGIEVLLIKKDTGRSITYNTKTTPNASLIMDWEFYGVDNYPKEMTLVLDNRNPQAAVNLLSTSCAEWDVGTQALVQGDDIDFNVYDDDGDTKTRIFYGSIQEIKQGSNGVLTLKAKNRMQVFESINKNIKVFKKMYDQETYTTGTTEGVTTIAGPTGGSAVIQPFAFLGYAHTDIRRSLGSGSPYNGNALLFTSSRQAYSFVAEGDGLIGIKASIRTITYESSGGAADGTVTLDIETSYQNRPSGQVIGTVGPVAVAATALATKTFDFTAAASKVVNLVKGERYFAVFRGNLTANFLYIEKDGNTAYVPNQTFLSTDSGATWSLTNNEVLNMDIDFADYAEINQDNIEYDAATPETLIFENYTGVTAVDAYYSFHRGKVTYFKDTVTIQEICERLIKTNTILRHSVNSNLDKTFGFYLTQGKSIAECLRELMDIFEDSGTFDGKQHIMDSYKSGTSHFCKIGKRLNTSDDTEFLILSHPEDTANDDERIIVGAPQISKNNTMKYAGVRVEGKDFDGNPIVVERSDKALSGSVWNQMDGAAEWLVFNDPNIRSYDEANTEAYRILDSVNRDVWEGTIKISGQYLAFDFDTSSASFGSGKIIKLNWSPLQISALKMKVTGMQMKKNETTLFVNNIDPIVKNRKTEGWGREVRTASFGIPTEVDNVAFINVFLDDTITGTPAYLLFKDSAGSYLDNLIPTDVTIYKSSDIYSPDKYNLSSMVGVMKGSNGFTKDSAYTAAEPRTIGEIEVYDSSDVLLKTVDLIQTVSSVDIDESILKFKGQKAIVEINYKTA